MSLMERREHTLPTRDGPVSITGTLIGFGTSESPLHSHADAVAQPGQKCKACRWSEVKIFRLDAGDFIVHTMGETRVPGELTKTRLVRTADAIAVIESLIVNKYERGSLVDTFVTRPALDALDMATNYSTELDAALETWLADPKNERMYDAA